MVEVAHDYQAQVQKYVVEELGLLNSYDTWHSKYKSMKVIMYTKLYSWSGTKNVAKLVAKIPRVQLALRESLGSTDFQTNVRIYDTNVYTSSVSSTCTLGG